jgi:hypothetical protein
MGFRKQTIIGAAVGAALISVAASTLEFDVHVRTSYAQASGPTEWSRTRP